MSDNDFEKTDREAGVISEVQVMAPENRGLSTVKPASDVIQFRQKLVEDYHHGAPSLAARLKLAGKEDLESYIVAMIDEVIQETDHLLGNELVATHNGDLRDASVISFKRAEVLEKAIKAAQTKQQFEKQGGVDVDSPAMIVIFRFFMGKAKETFEKMGVDTEIPDLFFRRFGEVTTDWKKDLRQSFEQVRNQR